MAQAESTSFPDEREAFVTKAHELMARYSIDQALLRTGGGSGELGEVGETTIVMPSGAY